MTYLISEQLSQESFHEFGEVLEFNQEDSIAINAGRCSRLHDLAKLDFDSSGKLGVSLFHSSVCSLPYRFNLMERHPFGPQVFFPLDEGTMLIIVASDDSGFPVNPRCFISKQFQGINIYRGIWHGVLTPLSGSGKFIVFDWIGTKCNLEEYVFPRHIEVK